MKKIGLLLLVVAMVFSFVACGKDSETFKVGFDAEYPPYGYMDDDGTYTGFDLEMAEAVAEYYDWDIELIPIEWSAKDMELNSGNIDCIWNGFTINGREELYTWSDAYVENSQVIVVAVNSGISTFADLSGKVVGVQSGSAALGLLQTDGDQSELGASFGELREFSDYNTAFIELTMGNIDALAMDIGVANYQISSRGDEYVIMDEYLNEEQYGIGFKLGNTELRDKVQKAVDSLKEDGTFEELAEKYGLTDYIITE